MTDISLRYNFMDLLKDKGNVPQTDSTIPSFMKMLASVLSGVETSSLHDYGFMDLLQDKGYVPLMPANDNRIEPARHLRLVEDQTSDAA